jgi:hypothetical protein
MARSSKTKDIEARLKAGHALSSIARDIGVSRQRVQAVNRRMQVDYSLVTATVAVQPPQTSCTPASVIASHLPMKSFTVILTTPVYDALVEACAITNRQSPQDPITIAEYTEQLIINKVVELGLLRKKVT